MPKPRDSKLSAGKSKSFVYIFIILRNKNFYNLCFHPYNLRKKVFAHDKGEDVGTRAINDIHYPGRDNG